MDEKKLCPLVRDLLPGLIDGVVSSETEAMLRTHLDGCDTCREMYEQLAKPEEQRPSEELPVEKFVKKHKRKQWLLGVLCGIVLCVGASVGYDLYRVFSVRLANEQELTEQLAQELASQPKMTEVSYAWDAGYFLTEAGAESQVSVTMEAVILDYPAVESQEPRSTLSVKNLTAFSETGEILFTYSHANLVEQMNQRVLDAQMPLEKDGSLSYGIFTVVLKAEPLDLIDYGYLYLDAKRAHLIYWKPTKTGIGYILCAGDVHDAEDAYLLTMRMEPEIAWPQRNEMQKLLRPFTKE